MDSRRSSAFHYVLLLLAIAFGGAIRFAYVIHLPGQNGDLLHSDMELYRKSGAAMAKGEPLVGGIGLHGYHPLSANVYSNAGYIWIVAAHYRLFGDENALIAIRLSQAAAGTLTILLVYLIGRRAFSPSAALAAAWLTAIHLPLTYYAGLVLTETWFTFLQLVFVYLATLLFAEPIAVGAPESTDITVTAGRTALALFTGIVGGMACAVREAFLPAVLLLILAAHFAPPIGVRLAGRWKLSLALLVGALLVILPITYRNYTLLDRFVLLSTNGPSTFYTSHVERSLTWGEVPAGMTGTQLEMMHREKSKAYLRDHWREYLAGLPEYYSQIWLASDFWPHVTKFWKNEPIVDPKRRSRVLLQMDEPDGPREPSILHFADLLRYNDQVVWVLLGLPASVFALFLLPRDRRTHRIMLIAIVPYLLIPLVAAWFPRYRVPAAPLIFLLAGHTLSTLANLRQSRRTRSALVQIDSITPTVGH